MAWINQSNDPLVIALAGLRAILYEIIFVLLAITAVLAITLPLIVFTGTVPDLEVTRIAIRVGTILVGIAVYVKSIPWSEDTIEAWRLAFQGWEHGL